MRHVLQHQFWHLLTLCLFTFALHLYLSNSTEALAGLFMGITTQTWFWLSILIPVLHQVYVLMVWRIELYQRTFTKKFGLTKAFKWYTIGFSILFISRLISIIFLALSNQGSLHTEPAIIYLVAAIITPWVLYLFYSVKTYFTFARAFGMDHFKTNYNEPNVKQGIFKYTDNGMYIFGLMVLYLPGLLLFSKAALLAALFNHLYIWVHFYCTERPDMIKIYGKMPSKNNT